MSSMPKALGKAKRIQGPTWPPESCCCSRRRSVILKECEEAVGLCDQFAKSKALQRAYTD